MDRRHRTALDHRCQSLALGGVQLARMARRLAVRDPLGAMRVEPQDPVPDRLQTDPADAGCLCPRAAVIDLGQCQKAPPLGSALRPPSHPAQASGVIVLAKCKPRSHGESPLSPPSILTRELLGSPNESARPRVGINGRPCSVHLARFQGSLQLLYSLL